MKFSIIYADPAWSWKTYSDKGKGKSPDNHYGCMALNDIKAIDVNSIAERDSVLIIWVLSSMLPQALDVIKSWGFTFKTVLFDWTKTTNDGKKDAFGMGYFTRQNLELCLLATKGKGLKVQSKSVRQEVRTPKEQHSKKPECVRDRIIELFGDLPRVELFARPNASNQTGWVLVGNEIDGLDINDAIAQLAVK
jgi:N6-adenosine-specific RNA methylase IME4